jgi:outer membrane protein assembly factor BamB
MSMTEVRQRGRGSHRWILVGALVAIVALLVYRHFHEGNTFEDLQQLKELQAARFSQEKPVKAKDWPQWRGPNRDGVSTETSLLTAWPEGALEKLKVWQQPTGVGFSSMAVAGGRVITIVQDGDSEAVVCWHADTGKELWRYRYACKYENDFGSGPRSTPTIEGDFVYTVGATGIMHCLKLDPKDNKGEKVWRKDLLDEFGAQNIRWGVAFSPLIEGNLIYTNPGGQDGNSLVALDKRDGTTVWKSQDDQAGYSSPVAVNCAGKRQIVFFTATGLVSVTPDSGALNWRFPWETEYGCNIATPIAIGDYVFISSGYSRGCTVVKIEASGGKLEAKRVYEHIKMCNHFSSCVLYKDHLYGFNDGILTCMEFRTGKVVWKERGFDKGSLLIADGHLIILGENGKLALAAATPTAYKEKAALKFSERTCWSVPVLANGRLYVRDEERIVCLDLRKK